MIPENLQCSNCKVELIWFDGGITKMHGHSIVWDVYSCPECGEKYSNEPDWDSMKEEI